MLRGGSTNTTAVWKNLDEQSVSIPNTSRLYFHGQRSLSLTLLPKLHLIMTETSKPNQQYDTVCMIIISMTPFVLSTNTH